MADGGSGGAGAGGVGGALNAELPALGRRALARGGSRVRAVRARGACACAAPSPSCCLVWGSSLQTLIHKERVLGPGVGACS